MADKDEERASYWSTADDESDQLEQPEPEIDDQPRPEELPDDPPISWEAQEYVTLSKGPWWFVIFTLIVLGLIAIDVFFLKSWTFSVLVVVMAVAIIIYSRRPPRTLAYSLSSRQGLYVGERLYHFDEFRAFGVVKDGAHQSIILIPRKRFSPGVSVYFPEEAGERIVDILGKRLPMENTKLDLIDRLVRALHL